jgi:hypothetical protein
MPGNARHVARSLRGLLLDSCACTGNNRPVKGDSRHTKEIRPLADGESYELRDGNRFRDVVRGPRLSDSAPCETHLYYVGVGTRFARFSVTVNRRKRKRSSSVIPYPFGGLLLFGAYQTFVSFKAQ